VSTYFVRPCMRYRPHSKAALFVLRYFFYRSTLC